VQKEYYIVDHDYTLKWMRGVFGYPHPSSIKVCFGGCFSVTRTLIQQHPIAFYKKLIPYVSHSRDPLEGHYLERLWESIFTLKLP